MKKNIIIMAVLLLIVMVTVNAQQVDSTIMVQDNLFIANGTPLTGTIDNELERKNIPNNDVQKWTGTWNTNRGIIKLVQVVNRVTGTYERGNGMIDGMIDGMVVGDKLTGNWKETSSQVAPTGAGFFDFTLAPSGSTGIFLWRLSNSKKWVEDKWAARISDL